MQDMQHAAECGACLRRVLAARRCSAARAARTCGAVIVLAERAARVLAARVALRVVRAAQRDACLRCGACLRRWRRGAARLCRCVRLCRCLRRGLGRAQGVGAMDCRAGCGKTRQARPIIE